LKYMRRDIARIMTLKDDKPKAEVAEAKEEQDSKKTADKK